ncbi:ribonuclease P protein component [Oscillatoria sp. FACHB-1407]|uniref:ribonuclease P protein component n=1 Tax=Oscillatoria sp. FACHB-1407 TaxID=2692847 RepID=UPI0016896A88|nr:ribonuclease P protein component [Oscillatoria sp. FACHB-1407]MBD2462409.1 ribonuclease P protein component [Oscillatoria sp. FACHB-1407]
MALPKANRLKRRQDFNAVYQMGLRRSAAHLTLRALKLPSHPATSEAGNAITPLPTCIGISISQKVSKRAVIRNRIKRQIRAALSELLPTFHPGWYCVIVVRPGAIQCDYQQFLQELKQLLVDAEVIDGY